jgi:putative ABC transport system permease protein
MRGTPSSPHRSRIARPLVTAPLLALLGNIPEVIKAEPANAAPAAAARADGLSFVRTNPDGGHGSLTLRALPRPDSLKHLTFLDGEQHPMVLNGEVILNQGARLLLGSSHPGDTVTLTVEGRTGSYRVAAVVREILTLPAVYAGLKNFFLGLMRAVHGK